MKLQFDAVEHKYTTLNKPEDVWTSVTSLISKFKAPFDKLAVAKKSVKKKNSKWYGMKA